MEKDFGAHPSDSGCENQHKSQQLETYVTIPPPPEIYLTMQPPETYATMPDTYVTSQPSDFSGDNQSESTTSPISEAHQCIFIFLNLLSGSNSAMEYIESEVDYVAFKDPSVEIFIRDISEGTSGDKPGFLDLRQKIRENCKIPNFKAIVIAAGGDGTVMWTASEIWAHGIDESKVVIGVIPFGTGNDFAKALNWQELGRQSPFANKMRFLKHICRQWLRSPIVMHDVWEIEVNTHPQGSLKQIDSKTRKKKLLTLPDTGRLLTNKRYKMNNYFSIGVESRIGIGFDRNRHNSQLRNKMTYVSEGMKKIMFKKTVPIGDLIEHLVEFRDGDEAGEGTLVFSTERNVFPFLKTPVMSLVTSNIPSFASGLDLWEASKGKPLGVGGTSTNLSELPQQMGDGKLEFLSFSSTASLGLEHAFRGQGRRVHQGFGPFKYKFKKLDDDTRTYFQVDGEFIQMTSPDTITLRLYKQLMVLSNVSHGLSLAVKAKPCHGASVSDVVDLVNPELDIS